MKTNPKIFTYKIESEYTDPNQIHDSLIAVKNEIEAVINESEFPLTEIDFVIKAEKVMTQKEYDSLPLQ